MKTIVINLKRSKSRKESMTRQLDMLGLEYEFFEGVDGASLSREEMLRVCNQRWAKRHIGRHLLKGEIGCALSHLGVYRKIVDEKLPFALVLEDDAQLVSSIMPGIEALEQNMTASEGFVCLLSGGADASVGTPHMLLTGNYVMAHVTSAAYSAYAYVVSQESAKRLLGALFPVVQVADDWGWISGHTGIELFACRPAMATQLQQEQSESTIAGNGESRSEDLSARWKRWNWWKKKLYCKYWRTVDRAGLGYYFWRNT